MPRRCRPLKIKEATKLILQTGATIRPGGKHLKVTHPLIERTFILPRSGSNKRSTISPGMSAELLKYLKECNQSKEVWHLPTGPNSPHCGGFRVFYKSQRDFNQCNSLQRWQHGCWLLPRQICNGSDSQSLDAQSCYFHGQNSVQALHQQKRF